jgi:plasmid stabilization system protein ParE
MKPAEFHPAADAEFGEAKEFYNSQVPGLGDEFYYLVVAGIRDIRLAPNRFPPYQHNTRRLRLKRFPYLIIYRETAANILIVAIAHGSRRSGYWAKRI